MTFPIACGDDIELRLIEREDRDALFRMIDESRASMSVWIGLPNVVRTPDEADLYIQRYLDGRASGECLLLGIWVGGELAGLTMFRVIEARNHMGELGYALGDRFRRRGIVTTTTRAMVRYGFETLKLNRIEINAATGNVPSRAIAERLGFTLEGISRQSHFQNGAYFDMARYALLASDWTG